MHFAMSNDEDPNGAVVSRLKRELFDLEEASVRNLQARKDMERQMDQLRQQVGGSWALRLRSVSVYPNAVCFVPDQHVPCSLLHSLSHSLSPSRTTPSRRRSSRTAAASSASLPHLAQPVKALAPSTCLYTHSH